MTARRVCVVGPWDMAAGFALAGLPVVEVPSVAEGAQQLADLLQRDDIAVLLADERLVNELPELVRRRAMRRPVPLLVPVPPPRWDRPRAEVSSYILDLLQRAVGYRVRLR